MQTQSHAIGQYLSDQVPDCSEVAVNGCSVEQCLPLLVSPIYLHDKITTSLFVCVCVCVCVCVWRD